MAIPRFTSTSGTRIWEHLNAIATAVESMFTAAKPFTRSGSIAALQVWAGGAEKTLTFTYPSLAEVPAAVPYLSSSPGGSHGLVPRIASVSKTSVTVRVYNTSAYEMKLSTDLVVSVLVTPL